MEQLVEQPIPTGTAVIEEKPVTPKSRKALLASGRLGRRFTGLRVDGSGDYRAIEPESPLACIQSKVPKVRTCFSFSRI